jgi:hypothetical protein
MNILQNLWLLAVSLLFTSGICAQHLVITLNNTSTESFAISDIQSIKFDSANMMLYEWNGTVNTWDINDIDQYAFDGASNINETTTVKVDNLIVYPNPSSNQVHIKYLSGRSGDISIHIYDLCGRHVEALFDGLHRDKTEVTWYVKRQEALPAGAYLINITTETKVIATTVIIQ